MKSFICNMSEAYEIAQAIALSKESKKREDDFRNNQRNAFADSMESYENEKAYREQLELALKLSAVSADQKQRKKAVDQKQRKKADDQDLTNTCGIRTIINALKKAGHNNFTYARIRQLIRDHGSREMKSHENNHERLSDELFDLFTRIHTNVAFEIRYYVSDGVYVNLGRIGSYAATIICPVQYMVMGQTFKDISVAMYSNRCPYIGNHAGHWEADNKSGTRQIERPYNWYPLGQ